MAMLRKCLIIFLISFSLQNAFILNCYPDKPQYGGTLRVLGVEAMVLGYPPEMGPEEAAAAFPAFESLMVSTPERKKAPFLAKDVDIDPESLQITFYLRQGVKFHDQSDFNAEAVAYNFLWLGESGKLQHWNKVKSVEVLDSYTVRLHLTEYNNMMIHSLCSLKVLSKQALTTQSVEWLRDHPVGTGPFKLAEWKRGSHTRWEKNPDYWQKGKPYLDAIEIRFIYDPMTAAMIMEKKEADVWLYPSLAQILDLEKKGMIKKQWPAPFSQLILLNTKDPDRPTYKLKVREAIEYALDKEVIAHVIGQDLYKPIKMVAPEGEWGYDPDYPGRPYNPTKAKQMLKEAGYSLPLKLTLLSGGGDLPAAIKSFMDQAGFDVKIDIADPGRFWGSMFSTGWPDMIMSSCSPGINFLFSFQVWFGHEPATNLASFKRSPQLLALSREAVTYLDDDDQQAVTKKLFRMLADEADVIPLFTFPNLYIVQPYVHCSFMQEFFRWRVYDDWMEKH